MNADGAAGSTSGEDRWRALALQTTCRAVNRLDAAAARSQRAETLAAVAAQVRASKAFIGPELRLVVLPEYFLSGFPMGESVAEWREKACVDTDGPEYQALGALCRDQAVHLSGNVYETDPRFPELYFQVSFILDDAGALALRYRRLVSMFSPTPHDVLDAWVAERGADSLFPVADTALGRLAAVASEEILFPEICRALALGGAEVICHSSSEVASSLATPKQVAKRARAFENQVYVVSANSAGITGADVPAQSADGRSQIVDYEGRLLCEAAGGESMAAHADIDLAAARARRRRAGADNMLSRQRLELFAPVYAGPPVHAANGLLDADGRARAPERADFASAQRAAIAALRERGAIR